jgi:hypothetical protein
VAQEGFPFPPILFHEKSKTFIESFPFNASKISIAPRGFIKFHLK